MPSGIRYSSSRAAFSPSELGTKRRLLRAHISADFGHFFNSGERQTARISSLPVKACLFINAKTKAKVFYRVTQGRFD
jgi:hypothetical protein